MLDQRGLGGLWREGLLARKVLLGETKGYKNHSQLIRWKNLSIDVLDCYLTVVFDESKARGYSYNLSKINPNRLYFNSIPVTHEQVLYEQKLLNHKLDVRAPNFTRQTLKISPIFYTVCGKIESWEKVKSF